MRCDKHMLNTHIPPIKPLSPSRNLQTKNIIFLPSLVSQSKFSHLTPRLRPQATTELFSIPSKFICFY